MVAKYIKIKQKEKRSISQHVIRYIKNLAHITDLSIIGSKLGNNNDSIDFKVSLFNWWYKTDLFCIRCLKFIKNNNLKKARNRWKS